ncbi:MAG TPA: ferrochelatase [Pseudacidobacterium sp.]|jgi:ferrochelatase|nr:ferrochelatase [Pseudacidobacterium sp.]
MADRAAVLLLAHGTPDSLDEIPEYLSNVTGGRPMPESVIEEIRHRYSLIGSSPLTQLTQLQGRLLGNEIDAPVYVAMRNWKPYIADVVKQMLDDGITSAVAICLAPQNSRTSVGLYKNAVMKAAGDHLKIDFVEGWAEHPLLAEAFAERLRPLWHRVSNDVGSPVPVLFTAHSVPLRTVEPQPGQPADPYADEAKLTAESVADCVPGLKDWRFAFQSQGMSGGPWIGPTVEDTLTALHQEGRKAVVIQPIGFLCDHVEILYDIDIAFREFGRNLGLRVERPQSLNSSPLLIVTLADLARRGLARLAAS